MPSPCAHLHWWCRTIPPGNGITDGATEAHEVRTVAAAAGFEFIPFVLETTGGWGPGAVEIGKIISKHAFNHAAIGNADAINTLIHGLSVAVQHGNTQLILGAYQTAQASRLPNSRSFAAAAPPLALTYLPDLSQAHALGVGRGYVSYR